MSVIYGFSGKTEKEKNSTENRKENTGIYDSVLCFHAERKNDASAQALVSKIPPILYNTNIIPNREG